ncbi:NAD(P)-dependent dehydrogenase, short-chain alcohol dehydrogenase family [Streptomyces sp. DvalAA-14]|uniref:SDR family NAD(P)-dependent oxidoreductase n=1 Tax=unclassified Streptomyces TaxID=2593676 RepID=UPI00081BA066|nr:MULTISPECIES: SDR family NAD(P)-dependent oxidoreductase [unclassified Streptomyces]MYS19673.1 SDR family oxidoreductase [Streptomyces sp. SID4948]SCD50242.1 NAD(P)-dependent dehydrogenase, short-chain alcohol dehydrogenase family [Streptomyces sp. DvalAA-14]
MTGRFDTYGVVVTGSARGIGEATARRFAAEGAAVLIADINGEGAEKTAAAIRADGGRAEAYVCDVADRGSVDAAIAHAAAAFDGLDVLVNNAYSCSWHHQDFSDESDEEWRLDLDISLTGAMRCSRAALPYLAAAPSRRGAIVNIGSVNGLAYFGNHAYSAAKAGLVSLTRTLAVHAAPTGVRVNLVAPGTIRTPSWDGREAVLEQVASAYPLGRVGEPSDIAAAVTFLASVDASWITGVTLPVEGGILPSNAAFTDSLDAE